jgi:hypothetical protein
MPLESATRRLLEPRFGHDFAHVRIHADRRAAESAEAVGAVAYTVGSDIVFGAGRYAPAQREGTQLLAHELTHVVQQDRAAPGGMPLQRARTPSGGGDAGTPAPTAGSGGPAPAPAATPPAVCGPDVTAAVGNVIADMNAAWGGWNATEREEACWSLQNFGCGPDAWDIVQLHNNAWIYQDYRPDCASVGATPPCGSTVQVDSDCHFAGSVNYVIFGRQCKLCDIWPTTMHAMIYVHKVHLSGLDRDYGAAKNWADAGYAGCPSAGTPGGDRNTCTPSCPTPYGPTANNPATRFDFQWVPTHTTATISGGCKQAIDVHRDLRDNPPDFSGGGLM